MHWSKIIFHVIKSQMRLPCAKRISGLIFRFVDDIIFSLIILDNSRKVLRGVGKINLPELRRFFGNSLK